MTLSGKEIRDLPDRDIGFLISELIQERVSRAAGAYDPETLAIKALEKGYTITGDPVAPQDMGGGIIAITNVVRDTSSVKHRCHLHTLKMGPEEKEEWWVWDENCPTYLYSETSKVDAIRRTVALHALTNGMVLSRHSMVHDGERHERKSLSVFDVIQEVDRDGTIQDTQLVRNSNPTPRRLPMGSHVQQ